MCRCRPALLILVGVLVFSISNALDSEEAGCHPSYFECANKLCVTGSQRCDHVNDCGDNSDEVDCDLQKLPSGPTSCPSDSYLCTDPPKCISLEDLCSDFNYCSDYDQIEQLCSVSCQPHKFKCLNVSHCILKKYLCDGRKDCMDASDELNCDDEIYKCRDEPDYFLCEDHSDCIFVQNVCDGHKTCDDGSDEKNDCYDKCEKKKCGSNQRCIPDGEDVKCMCADGYVWDESNENCIDMEYCNASDMDRPCSQTCYEGHGPHCRCIYGYSLNKDGQSCSARGDEGKLYIATASRISQWTINTEQYSTVVDGLSGVSGLAIDSTQRRIFWSENERGQPKVYSMSIEEGVKSRRLVASFVLQKPEGLSYDYIAKNLYIVDAGIPAILACELQQKHCTTVFNSSVVTFPKQIVLHPAEGVLYYTEMGKPSAIMKGSMDGTSIHEFVAINVHRPISLDIDFTTNRLYWLDAFYNRIFKIDLDGKNKKPVLSHQIVHPSTFAIFEDNIFWVNEKYNNVMFANKFTGRNASSISQHANQLTTALAVEHQSLQNENVINRCQTKRCHLCLLSDKSTGTCRCSRGYQADFSDSYCEKMEAHPFLLAADKNRILKLALNTTGHPTPDYIKTTAMNNMYTLAYLSKTHEILYTDMDFGGKKAFIGRVHGIDEEEAESVTIVQGLESVQSIAVDEASSLVFWTDAVKRAVSVASLDGSHQVDLPVKVSMPFGLALDTIEGILYYSELQTAKNQAMIRHCRLDGHFCSTLVKDRIRRPTSLVCKSQQVFWSDYELGEISSVDKWGNERTTLVVSNGNPVSFAIEADVLYWTEEDKNDVFYKYIHKHGLEGRIPTEGKELTGLIAAVPHTLPQSACSYRNGFCEQICISIKRSSATSCLCAEGFRLHEDGKQCVQNGTIQCKGFLCKTENICLSKDQVCDGVPDCSDAKDEGSCLDAAACSEHEFRCDNNQCISESFTCDGENDCMDGSDENNNLCPNVCGPDHHFCDKKKCIVEMFVCDQDEDCFDGSDELNCKHKCESDKFLCDEKICIPEDWVCDGGEDCIDGTDEVDCKPEVCIEEDFKCNNGGCIDRSEVCDYIPNCLDGEDEADCPPVTCTQQEFKCYTGDCIHESAVCDKIQDCSSHEDEKDCENKCRVDEFQCQDESCIAIQKRCNTAADCRDGSDEGEFCIPISPSKNVTGVKPVCRGFVCGTGHCIDVSKRCDGKPDCRDNSDEYNCRVTCKTFNKCAQQCVDTLTGVECKCDPGYRLMGDGFACEDIDECQYQNGGCSHRCVNMKGMVRDHGFKCQCFDGFVRGQNYYLCKARGRRPDLYISTWSGIKKVAPGNPVQESTVIPTKLAPIHMEVDMRGQTIYWTDYVSPPSVEMQLWRQQQKREVIFKGVIADIALDWVTGNMYMILVFNNRRETRVSVLSHDRLLATLLVMEQQSPKSLIVHPKRGVMFWISTTPAASVMKASMNGRGSTVMTEVSRHVHQSVSLVSLDVTTDRLYWVHPVFGQVKSATIDDKEIFTYDLPTNARRFRSMDIFEGILYFTSSNNTVEAFATFHHARWGVATIGKISRPEEIKVVHPLKQPFGHNVCAVKECMYMCVAHPIGGQCLCPDDLQNADNPHCEGPKVSMNASLATTTPSRKPSLTNAAASKDSPSTPAEHEERDRSGSMSFIPTCRLVCLNGGRCVLSGNIQSCRCPYGFDGPLCDSGEAERKQKAGEEEASLAWLAGLVIGILVIAFAIFASVWYFKYKRHNETLMSSIRFKKQNKFVICTQDDKDTLVPEISFGNPVFQEEINEEAHMHEDQEWWKKLISRSKRTVDSAFHAKNYGKDLPDDDIVGYLKGDPQDPVTLDNVRLLK